MTMRRNILSLLAAGLLTACTAFNVVTHEVNDDPVKIVSGTYDLDPLHWSLIFDVDHFGYSRYVTRFDKMDATLVAIADAPEKSSVKVVVKAASVNTRNPDLDKQLTGTDMFDAARFPDITFQSTSIKRTGAKTGEMTGTLTMRGKSHPVTLNVTFNGGAPDPLTGLDTLGFSATGKFDRSLWGMSAWWPAVGNEVRVSIEAEFVRPKNAAQ
ncbi:MAG: YceI family protein [Parvibaculum sp.]|nr:YceI family protein [Parvibaculum sp.]